MTNEHQNLFVVGDQDFEAQVLQSALPVIVDFWGDWCGHCHTLAPIYERLSQVYDGRLRFAKLNIDENPLTNIRFGVQAAPTLLLFYQGKLVSRLVGPHPARLQQSIDRALAEVSVGI